jgi:hypothetical protein
MKVELLRSVGLIGFLAVQAMAMTQQTGDSVLAIKEPSEISPPRGVQGPLRSPVLQSPLDHPRVAEKIEAAKIRSHPLPAIKPLSLPKAAPPGPTHAGDPLTMKLLVIAVDGTEPSYSSLVQFLDQIGIPYDTYLSVNHLNNPNQYPLPQFSGGPNSANYYGIILTVGNLAYCNTQACQSTFSDSDWAAMDAFTATFGVRTLSMYTFPEARYGLTFSGTAISTTSASPVNTELASGQALATSTFPYIVPTAQIPIENAYLYLASATAATGESTVPILSATYNGANYTVGVIHTSVTGQQYLALTMDHNPYLEHSLVLSYGLLNWVTHGIFLGAKKYYLSPEVDDFFISDDLFQASVPQCVPSTFLIDPTVDLSAYCQTVRISGSTLQTTYAWQASLNAKPQTAAFRVSMAFNGIGTNSVTGSEPLHDTLVPRAKVLAPYFYWMSHTYDHENFDCYDAVPNSGVCPEATVAQVDLEVNQNAAVGRQLFGSYFDATSMVTPEVSGLANPNFTSQGYIDGLRYVISDASKPGQTPPSANTGIPNALNPNLLEIPRFATNIFYNADTIAANGVGSETDEYNHFYGPSGVTKQPDGQPWFPTVQTYSQIIDTESTNLLMDMLRGYAFPSMYHQTNLYLYAPKTSLFMDTMNATINKFGSMLNSPIISQSESSIGLLLQNRAAYNESGVVAYWTPAGARGTGTAQGTIQILVSNPALIDLTGVVCPGTGATCETYGGQEIVHLDMTHTNSFTVASPF